VRLRTAWTAAGAALALATCMAGALFVSGVAGAKSTPRAAAAPDPSFGSWWHDGKAELDGYRYAVTRYGQRRRGQCVAVYVTEPFSRVKRVKVDDPARNPKDTFDVLKLNLVRDFQTGIYDYDTMTSLFVRSSDFEPVKVSFSSTEWCGNVYEELRLDPGLVSQKLSSYFEDESAARELRRPGGGMLEEELFVRLRGLNGEYLAPGENRIVPLLLSAFRRRLAHQPLRWTEARIERIAAPRTVVVPAGRFLTTVYTVETGNGHVGIFHVEAAYPHRIVRWEWKQALRQKAAAGVVDVPIEMRREGNDSGELTGSARLSYWKLHGEGDEKYLKMLGLGVR
jgi:hypothetical protein